MFRTQLLSSTEHIRTIDDEVYPSYRETCVAMGLVKDNKAEKALSEIVATHQSGDSIRVSFAVILVFLRPPNALNLWEKFKNDLCDDIRHRDECDEVTDVHIQIALHEIQGYLQEHDTCLEFFGLPVPTSNMEELRAQTSTAFELNDEQIRINKLDLEKEVAEMTANIRKVTGQSNAFDAIMNAVKGSGTGSKFKYHKGRVQNFVIRVDKADINAPLMLVGRLLLMIGAKCIQ